MAGLRWGIHPPNPQSNYLKDGMMAASSFEIVSYYANPGVTHARPFSSQRESRAHSMCKHGLRLRTRVRQPTQKPLCPLCSLW